MKKDLVDSTESLVEGHLGTDIYYAGSLGYVINVKLEDKPDVIAMSPCIFEPTHGMDTADASDARDREAQILFEELGRPCPRLNLA